jgi:hypothetical protein
LGISAFFPQDTADTTAAAAAMNLTIGDKRPSSAFPVSLPKALLRRKTKLRAKRKNRRSPAGLNWPIWRGS